MDYIKKTFRSNGQTIFSKNDEYLTELDISEDNATISWSANLIGTRRLRAKIHNDAKWINFHINESPSDKKRRSRETMFTLSPPAALELYERLRAVFD